MAKYTPEEEAPRDAFRQLLRKADPAKTALENIAYYTRSDSYGGFSFSRKTRDRHGYVWFDYKGGMKFSVSTQSYDRTHKFKPSEAKKILEQLWEEIRPPKQPEPGTQLKLF